MNAANADRPTPPTAIPLPGQLWPEPAGRDVFDEREDLPVAGDDEANEVLLTRVLRRAS